MARAKVVIGVVGALMLLSAALALMGALFFDAGSVVLALVNAAIVSTLAIAFMRGRDRGWIVILAYSGAVAVMQLALAMATLSSVAAISGMVNAAVVAAIIWAGRQLPENDEDVAAAAAPHA